MKKNFTQCLTFCSLMLLFQIPLTAQIELNTETFPGENEGEIVVLVTTKNFEEIAGMQFTINWNPTILEYQSVGLLNLDGLFDFSFNEAFVTDGELPLAWVSSAAQWETVMDGTSIFGLTFKKLSEEPTALYFDDTPTKIEFIKYPDQVLSLVSMVNEIAVSGRALEGKVLFDTNNNCLLDGEEKGLRDWTISVDGAAHNLVRTDENGQFIIYLPFGTHEVAAIPPPGNLFSICAPKQTITIAEGAIEAVQTNFAGQATVSCPSMSVELGVNLLERCFPFDPVPANYYTVAYCNFGTEAAENAYVEVEIDPYLKVLETELPYTEIGENIYRFELGMVDFSYCGSFDIRVEVDCEESQLGQTHCSSVKIFPNTICAPPSENWSKASLKVTGDCLEESNKVQFKIQNIGDGNMQMEQNFIVIEDMIMLRNQNEDATKFKLNSGETKTFEVDANGATYRLETHQVQNHPMEFPLAVAIEGCGTNEEGTFSKDMINKFEQADESQFEDIECRINLGLPDNNNRMLAFPNGYQSANYIEQNQPITYHIRFENDGSETASKVVIINPLSEMLDPSTVTPLVSSHPYKLDFEGANILKFTIENLEAAFVGEHYVKFKVQQAPNVPLGSLIENSASIYKGNDTPVITNTYTHTVGQEFIEVRVITSTNDIIASSLKISPNPFFETATVNIADRGQKESIFRLVDLNGRTVQSYKFSGTSFQIERGDLQTGMYLFEVLGEKELLGSGKIVISERFE